MKRNGWVLLLSLIMLGDSAFNLMMSLRMTELMPKLTTTAAAVCMLVGGMLLLFAYFQGGQGGKKK